MKIGTFSENFLRVFDNNGVAIAKEENLHYDQALKELNNISKPFGIIYDPWFEKVNAVSFGFGLIGGIGIAIGTGYIIKKIFSKNEQDHE